jgi:hypothetical protein
MALVTTDVGLCNLALAKIGDRRISTLSDGTAEADFCSVFYSEALDEALRAHPWNFAVADARLTVTKTAFSGGTAIADSSGTIRVTSTAHGLATNDRVLIEDVEGVTAANGRWFVTRIGADTFDLQDSVFSGTYTASSGTWLKVPAFEWAYRHALPDGCLRLLKVNGWGEEEEPRRWESRSGEVLHDSETADIRYVARVTDVSKFDPLFKSAFAALLAAKLAKPLTGSGGLADAFLSEFARVSGPQARRIDAGEGSPNPRPAWADSALVRARHRDHWG